MPLQTNLNVSPYYADYTPDSDYYKVLFKAGYPVQARELSNLQLMLQNQLEVFLSKILKEGDVLVPGEFSYQNPVPYVRVSSVTQGSTSADFIGSTVTGAVSGVKAVVQYAEAATLADDLTFYVSYVDSGTSTEDSTFLEGETLESDTTNRFTATVGVNGITKPITSNAMGFGTIFTINEGYYFIDGTAVRNTTQTITLDKYGITPSYSVGFVVGEDFINSSEDPLLLDNSQGSSNFAAPGADRLKIVLTLTKRAPDVSSPNFIQLANIVQGTLQGKPDQTIKWDWLYDILAKRTFDESGDYIVSEFPIEFLEYANSEFVDGIYDPDEDGLYPPVPGTGTTEMITIAEAQNWFILKVSPGTAYVQGYEVGYNYPVYLYARKPRDLDYRQNVITSITNGMNLGITNMSSFPDTQSIKSSINTLGMESIVLYKGFNDGYVGSASGATVTTSEGVVLPYNYGEVPPELTYHVITIGEITGTITGDQVQIYKGWNSAVVTSTTALKRGDAFFGSTITIVTEVRRTPIGVMNPRYLMPQQLLQEGSTGLSNFNSVFDVGITKSQFFEQIPLVSDDTSVNFALDWTVGSRVIGITTGAIGIVEQGTTPTALILSNIVGEFELGEELRSGTGASEKISRMANVGEVFELDFFDAGTGGSTYGLESETSITVEAVGATLTLTKGTEYTYNSTTNELELNGTGREKLLDFPFERGSRFNQRVNYNLTTVPSGVKGYAVTVAGKYENSISKVKSLFSSTQTASSNFSADVALQSNVNSEVIPVADNSLFGGTKGSNFITCENFSGDPSEELEYGDLVTFVDDSGSSQYKLVYFTSKPIGYGTERSQSKIYFTTTLENVVSGKTIQRIRCRSNGSSSESLLFQLPQGAVSTLEDNPDATGIDYTFMQEFITTAPASSNSITISTSQQNEQIINNLSQTTISIVSVSNDPTNAKGLRGRSPIVSTSTLSADNRTITYNFVTSFAENVTIKILAPVFIINARAKQKIFVEDATRTIPFSDANNQVISMGIADVFAINSITMGPDAIDVYNYFTFDTGQRDNFYSISTLTRVLGSPDPSDYLTITYSYFQHTGDGDFFSVDSYTGIDGIGYQNIPYYEPTATNRRYNESGANIMIALRDCLDFRPILNTAIGTTDNIGVSYLPFNSDGDSTNSSNFADTIYSGNGQTPRIPVRGSTFKCNLSYYLSRTYALFIDKTGALSLEAGISSNQPFASPPASVGLRLYNIPMPAYTYSLTSVKAQKFNYRRYRMKDISNMDKRLKRVEELVSLSILEQSALNMEVRDAVTGLNRFKNGIVVTGFNNHELGRTGTGQYRNSIDPISGVLRSPCFVENSNLIEVNQNNSQRLADGYRKTGGIVTLDYSTTNLINQPDATRFINLQPYSVFTFDGNMILTPSVDTFEDINRIPELVVEDNSLFDAMVNLTQIINDETDIFETVWGEWNTTSSESSNIRIENSRDMWGPSRNGTGGTIQDRRDWLANSLARGAELGRVNTTNGLQMLQDPNVPGDRAMGPWVALREISESTTEVREQRQDFIDTGTGTVVETSYGDRVVDVQLARTMRSRIVTVQATRLKPNTRLYLFFDEIDCSAWFSPDNPTPASSFPDGVSRFDQVPNTNPKGFGMPIIVDDTGTITGVFLIPNGRQPVQGSLWNGTMESVQYETNGVTRSFNTGHRKVRLSSSILNHQDPQLLESFAEADFVSSGVLVDKQETIVATREPGIVLGNRVVDTQSRTFESTRLSINIIGGGPRVEPPATNEVDPVCQTFYIDRTNVSGIYVTDVDFFFRSKDANESVEVYLLSTEGQVPTDQVIPFSTSVKSPDSILRVQCTNLAGLSNLNLAAGTQVVGQTSGATGTLKAAMNFSSSGVNPTVNVDNTIYNVILDNYLNEFVEGEFIVPTITPSTNAIFQIVTNEVIVEEVNVTGLGKNYTNPTVTFSSPQLKGGVTATGTVQYRTSGTNNASGRVYGIAITNKGSGYTQAPSATISDVNGTNATAEVTIAPGVSAVTMGVATSPDGTSPTKFRFQAPVYLLGDTNYGVAVRSPNSLNYTVYTARLGENQLGTENRVTEQASLGALFKSQNGGLWTEDQNEDIKFSLSRAVFNFNSSALITLQNQNNPNKITLSNPIETSEKGADATSTIFEENPRIIRVFSPKHGNVTGDLVTIQGIIGNPGGIPNAEINTLHEVLDAHFNWFTVECVTPATSAVRAGGDSVYISVNLPYEVINLNMGAINLPGATFDTRIRPTQAESITGFNKANRYTRDIYSNAIPTVNYYFSGPKVVANRINEAYNNQALKLRGQKSLLVQFELASTNDKISPYLDLERIDAIVVRNLIDNPSPTDSVYGMQTATVTFKNTLSDASNATSTLSGLSFADKEVLTSADAGTLVATGYNSNTRKLTLQGRNVSNLKTASTFAKAGMANLVVSQVSTTTGRLYVPETNSRGSVYSKWLSRLLLFEDVCDGLEIKLAAMFWETESIKMYFRARSVGYEGNFELEPWQSFNPNGLPDNYDRISISEEISPDPLFFGRSSWQSLTWSVQDLAQFDAVQVKIVMTASNPAYCPLIDDMQLVASE